MLGHDAMHPSLPLLRAHGPLDVTQPPLDLPSDSEGFDWSTETRCELLPTVFKPAKPESPIDINFDHSRAAMGESLIPSIYLGTSYYKLYMSQSYCTRYYS